MAAATLAQPVKPRTVATLMIVRTSPNCISFRLVAAGRIVYRNRVQDRPEGHQGARTRLTAWATAHGYRIVEQSEPSRRAS